MGGQPQQFPRSPAHHSSQPGRPVRVSQRKLLVRGSTTPSGRLIRRTIKIDTYALATRPMVEIDRDIRIFRFKHLRELVTHRHKHQGSIERDRPTRSVLSQSNVRINLKQSVQQTTVRRVERIVGARGHMGKVFRKLCKNLVILVMSSQGEGLPNDVSIPFFAQRCVLSMGVRKKRITQGQYNFQQTSYKPSSETPGNQFALKFESCLISAKKKKIIFLQQYKSQSVILPVTLLCSTTPFAPCPAGNLPDDAAPEAGSCVSGSQTFRSCSPIAAAQVICHGVDLRNGVRRIRFL